MSGIETLLVIGGTVIGALAIGKPVFGVVASIKPTHHIRYKYKKRQIKKQIKKAIEELDFDEFADAFDKIKSFDNNFESQKYSKYKKAYCINNEIIQSRKLFKIRFNPAYLAEQCSGMGCSNEELIEREQQIIKKENTLQGYEGYDALKIKEEILNKKEEELKEKEEEINELLKNFALLQ
jgi:hypothetical protein